ncbi:MAG: hypothetical protein UU47_C0003G0005 [candidate division TM6 bacterium GW2011_GWE2_41_16]|nr:MAG: hypothetical protein UU47_C0003G0005 [candidate division TM6 bacterium GW2011_GWE2_41_16]
MKRLHFLCVLSALVFFIGHIHATPCIKDVINCFAGKSTQYPLGEFFGPVGYIEVHEGLNVFRYFGIHKNTQEHIDYTALKHLIIEKLGLPTTHMIEFVGDSDQFSENGTVIGREIIRKHCAGNHMIEYGYTGHNDNPRELDINAFISEYVDQNSQESYRVIANLVGHSHTAMTQWHCSASPLIHNFVVVYNDHGMIDEEYTKFGDDVIVSDYILDPHDTMVCLEGGAQSFKQVTNALQRGCRIFLADKLRKPANNVYFSTAFFLRLIHQASTQNNGQILTKQQVHEIYQNYERTLKSRFNLARPDHTTKKALFDQAINEFIEQGIYEKVLAQCVFEN